MSSGRSDFVLAKPRFKIRWRWSREARRHILAVWSHVFGRPRRKKEVSRHYWDALLSIEKSRDPSIGKKKRAKGKKSPGEIYFWCVGE